MTTPGKQVIYVDVDDEITSIIDKMNATDARVVAFVLPKRATVFQSIVNMKLLKRRADDAKKHLVLITSEVGLMPLAGMVGVHVAKTLQSKPEIPSAPDASDLPEDVDEDESVDLGGEDFDQDKDAQTPVGALASHQTPGMNDLPEDTIELDNSDTHLKPLAPGAVAPELAAAAAAKKPKIAKKNKKLHVPNFLKFRAKLLIGILILIVLIVLWFVAFRVLPKATVTITTNTSDINVSLQPTLDTTATAVDTTKDVLPAQTQQQQKSNTATVPATGQQNNGSKATGSVTMSIPCSAVSGQPPTIPAGTGLSTNGLTFVTDSSASLTNPTFSGGCQFTGSTNVTAQQGGSQYNVQPTSFTVAGFDSVSASSGNAMSGGTDNIVKVVQQSDIDAATQKLSSAQDQNAVKQQLQQNLQNNGLYAITATFSASKPTVSSSAQVGDQADNVTVTNSTTYTMYGVSQDDLKKLIEASAGQQIDTSKQSILDDGIAKADFTVPNTGSGKQLQVSLSTTATAGPHLDVNNLAKDVAGKKSGDIQSLIKSTPGVVDVNVQYSPFWVTATPSNASKITIVFQKSGNNSSND